MEFRPRNRQRGRRLPVEDAVGAGIRVLGPGVELGRQLGVGESVELRRVSVERGTEHRQVIQLTALGRLSLNNRSIHRAVVPARTTRTQLTAVVKGV